MVFFLEEYLAILSSVSQFKNMTERKCTAYNKNNSRKNEGMEPKQKQYPVVDVTGDRSKVRCCKEQNCIGTWNVRSMNQGKLDVVKQEMERVMSTF